MSKDKEQVDKNTSQLSPFPYYPYPIIPNEEDEIDLYQLWLTLKKRKKIIFGSTLLFTLLGGTYILLSPPVYLKAGRFLAGDKGVRIEISRVVNGFEVGFWYTYSNTSNFTGANPNYHDKGVFVRIPLRYFSTMDTAVIGSYSLSPWTRDVGQLAGRPFDLYEEIYRKLPFYILDTANAKE